MEDEGRTEYIRAFKSKELAEAWIAAQAAEYFKPDDYYIVVKEGGI